MKIFKAINGEIALNPQLDPNRIYNMYYEDTLCFTCMIQSISMEYVLFATLISAESVPFNANTFYSIHYPEKADKIKLIPLVEDKGI